MTNTTIFGEWLTNNFLTNNALDNVGLVCPGLVSPVSFPKSRFPNGFRIRVSPALGPGFLRGAGTRRGMGVGEVGKRKRSGALLPPRRLSSQVESCSPFAAGGRDRLC